MKSRGRINSRNLNTDNSPRHRKQPTDKLAKIKQAKELLELIERYKLTSDEFEHLATEELQVPTAIFSAKLTTLESVVKYLKEVKKFTLKQISETLNRDQRNIWHIYDSVKKKAPKPLSMQRIDYVVPVSIFSSKKLSAQESLVSFLRDKEHMSFNEIASVLNRSDSTIRTVYNRGRKKYVK